MSDTLLAVTIGNPCGACIVMRALTAGNQSNPQSSQTLLTLAPDAYLGFTASVNAAFPEIITSFELDVRDSQGGLIYSGTVPGPVSPGTTLSSVTLVRKEGLALQPPDVFSFSVKVWTASATAIHCFTAVGPANTVMKQCGR